MRFPSVRPTKISIAPVGEVDLLSNIRVFPRSSRLLTHQSQPSVTICVVPRLFGVLEKSAPQPRRHVKESNIIGPIRPITDIRLSYSESWLLFIWREKVTGTYFLLISLVKILMCLLMHLVNEGSMDYGCKSRTEARVEG